MRIALILSVVLFASWAQAATLQSAFESALKRSESVGQNRERVLQAQERASQASGSVFPTVSVSALHQIQPEASTPAVREFFPARQTSTQLTLSQPLFRGFREFAGIRQQNDLLSAQQESRRQSIVALYEEVATGFLNILSIENDLRNLAAQSDTYGRRVAELRSRVRTGESNRTEVLSAESTQAALLAETQLVKGQLRVAREAFASLTGLPADVALEDPKLLPEVSEKTLPKIEGLLNRLELRPDLKEAQERLKAATEEVSIARGAHWPTADLIGNYYFQRPVTYDENMDWDLQFRLTLPIFEGGVTSSRVREAVSKKGEAELELTRIRRIAEQQVKSLHESLRARVEQLSALEKSVDLAERNSQVLQRDYRRGLARNIDVQMALTELRVARRGLDQARAAAQLEWIRLQIASVQFPPALEGALQ